MLDDLKISLPLYEGPLDLLLELIRRQKLDVYDIPIAKITEQYLEYLHLMEELNVDVASEFLVIAAQLIYLKSGMLRPPDPNADPAEQEDPRAELVRRLLEYEKFKNAAQMLYQRELVENAAWSNPGSIAMEDSELEPEMAVTLYDLLLVFRDVLKRAEQRPLIQVDRDEFSVEQMMAFLFEKIVAAPAGVALLAVLELTRLHAIYLKLNSAFGEITARANPNYELSKSFSPA